jgi:hypothetical protein
MLSIRALRKKRNGVSIITAALGVIIVIIIIAVGLFMLLNAGGLVNDLYNVENSLPGANAPALITLTTTNSTLAPYIYTTQTGAPGGPVLVLQPNINYTFQVTVIALNAGSLEVKTPVPVTLSVGPTIFNVSQGAFFPGSIFTLTPISGVTPYNATLTIRIPSGTSGTGFITSNLSSTADVRINVESA